MPIPRWSRRDDGQVWLAVAHEALLTGWRPLDTATADIIAALRAARAVEQAAAEWNNAHRPEHYLRDDRPHRHRLRGDVQS
jgi:hypothetical protein